MESLREYAISIIAASLICSVVSGILKNSAASGIIRMISGIVLTITIAAPLWNAEVSFPNDFEFFLDAADAASREGRDLSREAMQTIIKKETEAYIQDKAAELHASVTADVTLNNGDPPIPEHVVICGQISPYAKLQLEKILHTQLGLSKEHLEWTG